MVSFFVLPQIVIRTLAPCFGTSVVPPQNGILAVNPSESALAKNTPITPLQSALPKSLDLKSFRIRTYETRWGEEVKC